ncbi:hypothetical protein [Laspinema olomoucense]|uniref:asparagine synthase (glutamine-hydrolyzing) n=1 Tax=Laspinema olomoucense D3b TaxID=2953688 RepID=A0ABT2N6S1_9CYAN|nr:MULTISPECIES: hypothetical protein [unclassified Laspinema]MCT7972262.1 hypothetical protein [Laspinema sp. D3d]MCT7978398.1 hypothetical protein [Laspinema sp. D3b]
MNLFLIAWNLPKEQRPQVMAELRQMTQVYPQLDPDTIWHQSIGTSGFTASMYTRENEGRSRRYVFANENQTTFYDGCLVARSGDFNAYDASALDVHWKSLPEELEGHFVVVRLDQNQESIELLTDFVGMEQVFYLQRQDMWLISNSVRLISRISQAKSFDPLGVSQWLTMGWVGSDRTLHEEIRVIPGSQHWKWQQGRAEPSRSNYYNRSQLSRKPQTPLTQKDTRQLAEEMTTICRYLAAGAGELECPITAGRDSRLMASFLLYGGIDAQYYTYGFSKNPDVILASKIAEAFNLRHQTITRTNEDVNEAWETTTQRLIRQNDGTISLWYIADVLGQPAHVESLFTSLWGVGSGSSRGIGNNPEYLLFGCKLEELKQYMGKKIVSNRGGFIRPEATALAQEALYEFIDEALDDGFSVNDVPDLYATYERVRRWGGSNARKVKPIGDFFSPFCTRPFTEAVFAIPPAYRYSESLHYEIMKLIMPQLHSFPFDKAPWPPQNSTFHMTRQLVKPGLVKAGKKIKRLLNILGTNTKKNQDFQVSKKAVEYERSQWIKGNYLRIRETCLSQPNSLLWNFVDKAKFEAVTSDLESVTSYIEDPTNSLRHLGSVFGVATLFYYTLDE